MLNDYNDKKRIIKDKKLPKSIRSVVQMYPINQINRQFYGGLPHIGNALWGSWSSDDIQAAADTYDDYSLSNNLLIEGFKHPSYNKVRFGGGSPGRFKPFPPCMNAIDQVIEERILSDYPLAAGDNRDKQTIIEYFNKACSFKKIKEDNIIFTHSSTQAFSLVMEAILDYGDVVIMTSPNYGLFSFIPERVGGRVKLLELSENDNWRINPEKLSQLITRINKELQTDYDRNRGKYIFRQSDTPPKVIAFLNINPHNPTGIVYGDKEKDLLSEISSVCKDAGVFVIDDLAYSGLEYDRENLALPISFLESSFDNTISLYTLSKSYCLAGIRSGVVICNEVIGSLIRDRIFQLNDSLSILSSSAMSAIFKSDEKSIAERNNYLQSSTEEYYERYIFIKGIINGISNLSLKNQSLYKKIILKNEIKMNIKDYSGIDGINIIIEPESGFFVLLDLTQLIGRSYKGFYISDDKTLLQFLYTSGNIKALTGKAFCWKNKKNKLVVRVTTALDYEDLLTGFNRLKMSVNSLD